MSILPDTQFYVFHQMPYVGVSESEFDSMWVDLPSRVFDPKIGQQLFKRYISELVLADRLGFEGIIVNEHHATAYSMLSAPCLIAAMLVAQTHQAKVCVWGTPVTLEYPARLAEAYATLDVVSGGRLEVAIPLGTPMEYWVNPVNPVTARERQREATDLIIRAWTEDRPFRHEGKFFSYKYVNVWPRPYQKPHPKVYFVGSGSPETVELAAERGFGYAATFSPIKKQMAANQRLRERAPLYGHEMQPDHFPLQALVNVADSDDEAVRDFEPHLKYYFGTLSRAGRFTEVPGYLSLEEYRKRNGRVTPASHGQFDWNEISTQFRVVAGTPSTVAKKLETWAEEMGTNRIVLYPHIGDMPHWKVVRNLTMLAEDVIPMLRQRQKISPLAHPMAAAVSHELGAR